MIYGWEDKPRLVAAWNPFEMQNLSGLLILTHTQFSQVLRIISGASRAQLDDEATAVIWRAC